MRRSISRTLQLTLLFSAVATVVCLAFGWVIERSINEHFIVQDNKELEVAAQTVKQSLATLHVNDDIFIGHHKLLLYISDGS